MQSKGFIRFVAILLAIAAVFFSLVACQKSNPEPEPTPVPEPPTFTCTHSDIEHVSAVRRTATTPGNIAHWHCNCCNRNFLDEGATKEVQNAYLPAGNLSIDTTILNRIQHIYPFVPSSEQTKGGSVPQAIGNLFKIVLNFKHSATEKAQIQALVDDLRIIEDELAEIDTKLTAIEEQNRAIITMLTDISLAQKIQDLLNKEVFIYKASVKWFSYIKNAYEQYNSSTITLEAFESKLYNYSHYWAQESFQGTNAIYPMTVQMIDEFDRCYIFTTEMSYPKVFHKFNTDFRKWDNEGYTDRQQLDLQAEACFSIGYFMCGVYLQHGGLYQEQEIIDDEAGRQKACFETIQPLVDQDINNMNNAWNNYRRFHDGNTEMYICKNAIIANGDGVAKFTHPYLLYIYYKDESSVKAGYQRINEIMDQDDNFQFGWKEGTTMTVEDYTTIRNAYTDGNIYDILKNSAQIVGMPAYNSESYIRYYSSKDNTYSYSQQDCKKQTTHAGPQKFVGINYKEFYFCNHCCGCDGSTDLTNIYAQEMKENCVRGNNRSLEYHIFNSSGKEFKGDYYVYFRGKKTDWEPCPESQIYLKKYTGEIYDEL